jgi:hypothetical protein
MPPDSPNSPAADGRAFIPAGDRAKCTALPPSLRVNGSIDPGPAQTVYGPARDATEEENCRCNSQVFHAPDCHLTCGIRVVLQDLPGRHPGGRDRFSWIADGSLPQGDSRHNRAADELDGRQLNLGRCEGRTAPGESRASLSYRVAGRIVLIARPEVRARCLVRLPPHSSGISTPAGSRSR